MSLLVVDIDENEGTGDEDDTIIALLMASAASVNVSVGDITALNLVSYNMHGFHWGFSVYWRI